ncbi:MAG: glycosyltransferase family 4 protein [Bacteroidia bacterium]
MKILQICNKPPLPPVDGGCMAMHSITEALMLGHMTVQVLAMETDKHPFRPEKLPPGYLQKTNTEVVYINTKVNPAKAFINLFQDTSYNVDRFISKDFERKLSDLLEQESYDIIHLESIYVTPYIPLIREKTNAPIVLRAHNVESLVWERRTAVEKNNLKKFWFGILTEKLKHYEEDIIRKVDAIVPITSYDADVFELWLRKKGTPILVLPYAMKLPERKKELQPIHKSVFHIGAMDWLPNINGVKWLVREVWPKVITQVPDATLHLAGKGLKKDDPAYSGTNIVVHGEVEDSVEFMQQHQVMAVPLFSGGGMKIKMIEGMATGKAIVTTPIGIEGIHFIPGVHGQLATNEDQFAEAIIRYFRNPGMMTDYSLNAYFLASDEHEIKHASQRLCEFYYSLLL